MSGSGLILAAPTAAFDFGDVLKGTVERATQSEVQRKVDQETLKTVRCALGDARCEKAARARRGAANRSVPTWRNAQGRGLLVQTFHVEHTGPASWKPQRVGGTAHAADRPRLAR